MTAAFVRPTHAGHDVEPAVPHAHAGVYVAEVALPLAGVWEPQVSAQCGDDTYRMSRRVYLKP